MDQGPESRRVGERKGVVDRDVQNQARGWQETQTLPWLYELGSIYRALAIPGPAVPTGVAANTDCRVVFGEVS